MLHAFFCINLYNLNFSKYKYIFFKYLCQIVSLFDTGAANFAYDQPLAIVLEIYSVIQVLNVVFSVISFQFTHLFG